MMMGIFTRVCNDYNCYLIAVRSGDEVAALKWARYMHLCWPAGVLEDIPLPPPTSLGLRAREAVHG